MTICTLVWLALGAACGSSQVVDSDSTCGVATASEALVGDLNANTVDFVLPSGLPVILKQTPGNPVVSAQLYFDGGARLLTAENAGIDQLALTVATTGGTETLADTEFAARLDAMGSSIGGGADLDYNALGLSSLRVYFDETWLLFRGIIREPAFPPDEVELARQRLVQNIRMRREDPDSLVVDVARELLFVGHPYVNQPMGTEASVTALTRDQLVQRYGEMFDASRMLLVVVGDLSQDELTAIIGDTFATLTNSGQRPALPPSHHVEGPGFTVSDADLPTNYILGLAAAPAPNAPDYPALRLASQHLGDRLFEEVRTKRNLSYAVDAGVSSRLANWVYLYVTAVDPAATLPVMWAEVERLRTTPLTEAELQALREVFITGYYMAFDSNSAIGSELAWWELYGGGREEADRYIERLGQVTTGDIQAAAQAYLQDYQFAVVGQSEAVSESLFSGPSAP
jgi:predicted Zn-dependent peptidase